MLSCSQMNVIQHKSIKTFRTEKKKGLKFETDSRFEN